MESEWLDDTRLGTANVWMIVEAGYPEQLLSIIPKCNSHVGIGNRENVC